MRDNKCLIKDTCPNAADNNCFSDPLRCARFMDFAKTHADLLVKARVIAKADSAILADKKTTIDLFDSGLSVG